MEFAQKKTHLMTVNAHRGYNKEHPENTILAYTKAIELGAEYIELDVRRSKDGVLIISHDEDLKRSANLEKSVHDLNLEELKQVDLGQDQTIPTLEEVLQLCKGKIGIHVEIKEIGLCEHIASLITRYSMEDEVIFSSFKHAEMLKIKNLLPDTPTAICVPADNYGDLPMAEIYKDVLFKAELYKVQGIHINILSLEEELIPLAHEKGLWVNTFNVDSYILWETCLDMGVDGIFTNDAKAMIEFLSSLEKE